jgi:hypothetical protein
MLKDIFEYISLSNRYLLEFVWLSPASAYDFFAFATISNVNNKRLKSRAAKIDIIVARTLTSSFVRIKPDNKMVNPSSDGKIKRTRMSKIKYFFVL